MENGGTPPRIFTTALDGGWVSFALRLLYSQKKSPRYPLDMRVGGPQSRSRNCEEEALLLVLEIKPSFLPYNP
jgi:hypothetical protein